MDPLFAPLLFKAGLAMVQGVEGNQLGRSKTRPKYELPDSQIAALEEMKMLASQTKAPGQDLANSLMDADFANSTRRMIEASDSPNQVVENLAAMNSNQNRAKAGMAIRGAEMQRQNKLSLVQELDRMAEFERQQFIYDKVAPYEEAMAASKAKKDAAAHNIHDALGAGSQLYSMNNDGVPFIGKNPNAKPATPTKTPTTPTPFEEEKMPDFELLNPDYFK